MKRILILTIFILVFCFEAFGQDCPTIKVIPPSKLPPENGFMLFSVLISGNIDTSKLEYNWSISQGNIFDGQGTTAITVSRDGNLQGEITATIKINGLMDGCKTTSSESFMLPPKMECGRPMDTYGKLPWMDEKARMFNLINELTADPEATGFLLFSIKNDSEIDSVLLRQKKILKFLQSLKISISRVSMQIVKDGAYETRIWYVPKGANLPL